MVSCRWRLHRTRPECSNAVCLRRLHDLHPVCLLGCPPVLPPPEEHHCQKDHGDEEESDCDSNGDDFASREGVGVCSDCAAIDFGAALDRER